MNLCTFRFENLSERCVKLWRESVFFFRSSKSVFHQRQPRGVAAQFGHDKEGKRGLGIGARSNVIKMPKSFSKFFAKCLKTNFSVLRLLYKLISPQALQCSNINKISQSINKIKIKYLLFMNTLQLILSLLVLIGTKKF